MRSPVDDRGAGTPGPRVEPLGDHDRSNFSCGAEPLDRYLRQQAGQDARRRIAAPFVLILPGSERVAGYYTLAATAIRLADLPAETARRLPKYPLVPATLLGRLAVDAHYRGQGWGRFLLADALLRCVASEIASYAVVVDAKDVHAERFYLREGFLTLPDTPNRLFRRISDIAELFGKR